MDILHLTLLLLLKRELYTLIFLPLSIHNPYENTTLHFNTNEVKNYKRIY